MQPRTHARSLCEQSKDLAHLEKKINFFMHYFCRLHVSKEREAGIPGHLPTAVEEDEGGGGGGARFECDSVEDGAAPWKGQCLSNFLRRLNSTFETPGRRLL
jgi:hypothetical protein